MTKKFAAAAIAVLLTFAAPAYAAHSSGSHYVHPYCHKSGSCVRGHMSGNPYSGEHWHLNKDGSDTVTHSNGTRETMPNVAPPK